MTYEEAMDRCIVIRDTLMSGTDLSIVANISNIEWITMCAESIEKQIPARVDESRKHGFCRCPNGHNIPEIYNGCLKYCPCCGQAIDWSDEHEI